ncbi:MAG: hypothetical protein HDR27_08795 [Lachnospiraceae bacterium]|nr:hypothetical protein [Lachnospiraceae bacterium]
MKTKIENDKIWLYDEREGASYIVIEKPQIDDYSNVTIRPLVLNYHLKEKTIWERSCQFVQELQTACMNSPYYVCYILLFRELYTMLMSSSQTKNIISYGMEEENEISGAFQSLVTFMKKENSFIVLPARPFVFSALLNSSCQAAVVCLDACEKMQTVYDAVSRIRNGGKLFLYTMKDIPDELSVLPCNAEKRVFGSCTLYSVTIDSDINRFAQENNSESAIIPLVSVLLNKFGELRKLSSIFEGQKKDLTEAYLYITELLWQIEAILIDLYDVLENPELPILANVMREAAMDCYIGICHRVDIKNYFNRMRKETQIFIEAMQAEFE